MNCVGINYAKKMFCGSYKAHEGGHRCKQRNHGKLGACLAGPVASRQPAHRATQATAFGTTTNMNTTDN